jgi:putative CRISPR-associated protein (TIGR02620 family)
MKIDLIVTRHPGLVQYLTEEGIVSADVETISHASPEAITGRHVLGVLPHSLSCLTASFTEIPMRLPAELRGKELTVEDVRKYAGAPVTYHVEVI